MPTLKQINCSIEVGAGNAKLKEYGARYSDGHVETFVAVPDTDIPFTVHLKSEGYIAPGLAFFIFMDGKYQCNRNRIGLRLPGEGVEPSEFETEFRLRQKEEKTNQGSFVARDWTFAKLNRVAADKAPKLNPQFMNNVGTIEIVALRCKPAAEIEPVKLPPAPPKSAKAESVKSKKVPSVAPTAKPEAAAAEAAEEDAFGGMMGLFDGACDVMSLDGAGDERPVGRGGRVTVVPGMEWDPVQGGLRHSSQHPAHDDRDSRTEVIDQAKDVEDGFAQVDGHGRPMVVINQWGDRGQDDMRGDQYLGYMGEERDQYKQHLRETGHSVSNPPGHRQNGYYQGAHGHRQENLRHQGPVFNVHNPRPVPQGNGSMTVRQIAEDQRPLPFRENQAANDMERMRREFKEFLEIDIPVPDSAAQLQHRKDTKEYIEGLRPEIRDMLRQNPNCDVRAARENLAKMESRAALSIKTQKETVAKQAHEKKEVIARFEAFKSNPWTIDAFIDVEVMRRAAMDIWRYHSDLDLTPLFARLRGFQKETFRAKILQQPEKGGYEGLSALHKSLCDRLTGLSWFYGKAQQFEGPNLNPVRERLEEVQRHMEAMNLELQECEDAEQQPYEHGLDGYPNQGLPHNQGFVQIGQRQFQPGEYIPKFMRERAMQEQIEQMPGFQHTQAYNDPPLTQPAKRRVQNSPVNNVAVPIEKRRQGPGNEIRTPGGFDFTQPIAQKENTWHSSIDDPFGLNKKRSNQSNTLDHFADNQDNDNAGGAGEADGWGEPEQKGFSPAPSHRKSRTPSEKKSSSHGNWNSPGNGDQGWGGDQKGGGDDWAQATPEKGGDDWGAAGNQSAGNDWEEKKKSSHHSSKSHRSFSAHSRPEMEHEPRVKPYWNVWNKEAGQQEPSETANKRKHTEPRPVYKYPARPSPVIPEGKSKDASYGVKSGKGTDYTHLCRRPIYIDTMESPYAVFSFKYRSKEALEKILRLKIDDLDVQKIRTDVEKDRYLSMPKHRLVEELMNKRAPGRAMSGASSVSGSKKSEGGWGGGKSGGGSNRGWGGDGADAGKNDGGSAQGWGAADDNKGGISCNGRGPDADKDGGAVEVGPWDSVSQADERLKSFANSKYQSLKAGGWSVPAPAAGAWDDGGNEEDAPDDIFF